MPANDAQAGGVQVIRIQSHEMDIFCKEGSLGSNPDIHQKYKMADISKRVANTLKRAKKIRYIL
jgi:hypothetical protein